MSDWYLPSTLGMVLTYEERFDDEKTGETRIEVVGVETRGEETILTLLRTKGILSSPEYVRISAESAWKDDTKTWDYPVREKEWITADPRVGTIHHRLAFGDPVQLAGEYFERVVLLTHSSEGGQSTQAFAPSIGLLYSHYLADGTPGGSILQSIERTERTSRRTIP